MLILALEATLALTHYIYIVGTCVIHDAYMMHRTPILPLAIQLLVPQDTVVPTKKEAAYLVCV